MSVKLLTEHHLEFLSLKGGCTGSSVSTLVKMQHCWKSHVAAQIVPITVKPVLGGHSKRRPKLVFKTDYRLMQVKRIAECSKRAFCNTFDLH